ncbi:Uncharacterised protein [Legionella steigerwaltii]|uniref:Transmembrane protein n=1 Tax=Legionella steigerwaltii TaxID=460 RepID=A0A378L8S3_9GAMM|nr:hypothetical protein [Legionella steigerwaltii]KTD76226.1 hypothetical protein Lstg_2319 [Legionella steigerwaltii]STY22312.1 Uncharacterised protein [Legionella steigerwaltii]
MLRKFGLGLLCVAASLSTSAYSMETHLLRQGVTIEYELPSNDPQLFLNYLFWPVEANCKIVTEDVSDEFLVMALAKKGKINDISLSAGESLRITVHPGENLKISAESGAKVEITNFGQHTVKAICTA